MAAFARASETPPPPKQLTRPDERDYVASAAFWGAQVQANPGNVEASLNFSRNLRMMGGAAQAVTVMKDLVMRAPNDGDVLAEYGKALTAAERPDDAIGFLTQAIQLSPNDWTLLSARGVAYDQANNHVAARADYQHALSLDPDNSSILTNLAMSYVLAGQPAQAEPILRRVVARPDSTATMRQNLAMVLALLGQNAEAAALGRMDLAPEDANSNVQLFTQFDVRRPSEQASPASAAAPLVSERFASSKSQVSLEAEAAIPNPRMAEADAPIGDDPMTMPAPSARSPVSMGAAPAAATRAPVQMTPVADDVIVPPAAAKPKPVKRTAPKATAATVPAKQPTAKAITTNGEHLITTIDGIPVIGEAKPKVKPEAAAGGALRGRSL